MKTVKLMVHWPAVILTSMFTPFMYHATDHNGEQVIVLSKKWTIINSVFSTVVSSVGNFVIIEPRYHGSANTRIFIIGSIFTITLILTLSLILGLFYGHKCCCCSPKLKRSGLCVNNYDKTIDVDVDGVVDDANDEEMKALN